MSEVGDSRANNWIEYMGEEELQAYILGCEAQVAAMRRTLLRVLQQESGLQRKGEAFQICMVMQWEKEHIEEAKQCLEKLHRTGLIYAYADVWNPVGRIPRWSVVFDDRAQALGVSRLEQALCRRDECGRNFDLFEQELAALDEEEAALESDWEKMMEKHREEK